MIVLETEGLDKHHNIRIGVGSGERLLVKDK